MQRLLAEEGLFYWWEHEGDASSPSLGSHTLVIADHNGALASNPQGAWRYTQGGAVFKQDSVSRWRERSAVHTGALQIASDDYRSLSLRPQTQSGLGAAVLSELSLSDTPGHLGLNLLRHG